MATILDDAESMLNEAFFEASSTRASDDSAGDGSTTGTNVDYHARQYPAYQPPHLRGHNTQQDDFVNFKAMKNGADNPDKKEGVDNDKYQRLKLPVPFALSRNKLQALKMQFPGVYFHCKDNGNHDHEFSHIVTMIGTRMMQRAYPMGSRILDMYGNPNACDTYNKNQLRRAPDNARTMKAAVHKFGPADFIREVNKWGPKMDAEENERYYTSNLRQMIDSGELDKFDIMQFTHTLYYVDFRELVEALHQGKKRTAYALIHRHQNSRGTINDGEQEYEKKTVNMFGKEVTLLRQINVSTRAAYVHPDLTPLIFKEGEKQWYPEDSLDTRSSEGKVSNMGLSWDFKMVNEETWIIQLCPITRSEPEPGEVNYAEIFMNGGTSESDAIREEVFADDPFNMDLPPTPSSSSSGSCVSVFDHTVTVPGERGEFVKIELTNMQLFEKLRANVAGKKRDPTVFNEIIRLAKHLNDPSTITGDKIGMAVEASKIIDHVVAAFVVDIESESQVLGVTRTLQPILHAHASKFGFKADPKHMTFGSLLGTIRVLLGVGVELNQVYKSKDKIGRVLEAGIQRIDDYR